MIEHILRGLRVIDLTQNVAGPFCTQILGDMGADVLKVERPGSGDDTRAWLPPQIGGKSSTFLALNRNKQSICIDLDQPEGVAVLRKLAARADIVVHSFKPGSAESRGFGWDDLRQDKADLVYCAISAFGQAGPLRQMPGYDPLMQAFTGIMSVTGNPNDDPVRVPVSLIDMGTGLWAALGIVGAVLHRMRSGQGMDVRASLMDTGLSWMTVFVASYLASGKLPQKMGSAMAMTAPYELFKAADGSVFIAAGNDRLFAKVCEALGCAQLASDPRFATNTDRLTHRADLHELMERQTQTLSCADAVQRLRKTGAPCSELNDIGQVLRHEQVIASQMVTDLPVEGAAQHQVIALPLTANGQRSSRMDAPPLLGADTDQVLRDHGYDEVAIAQLRRSAVVA